MVPRISRGLRRELFYLDEVVLLSFSAKNCLRDVQHAA